MVCKKNFISFAQNQDLRPGQERLSEESPAPTKPNHKTGNLYPRLAHYFCKMRSGIFIEFGSALAGKKDNPMQLCMWQSLCVSGYWTVGVTWSNNKWSDTYCISGRKTIFFPPCLIGVPSLVCNLALLMTYESCCACGPKEIRNVHSGSYPWITQLCFVPIFQCKFTWTELVMQSHNFRTAQLCLPSICCKEGRRYHCLIQLDSCSFCQNKGHNMLKTEEK